VKSLKTAIDVYCLIPPKKGPFLMTPVESPKKSGCEMQPGRWCVPGACWGPSCGFLFCRMVGKWRCKSWQLAKKIQNREWSFYLQWWESWYNGYINPTQLDWWVYPLRYCWWFRNPAITTWDVKNPPEAGFLPSTVPAQVPRWPWK